MNNKVLNLLMLSGALFFTSCYMKSQDGTGKQVIVADQNVAVLELFTSEGCSSCPPAEKLLQHLQATNKQVYLLSYHVDYWNRLGWKDPFSQAAFTERQKQIASQFNLESIYTPQLVVNGIIEFTGSDEQTLQATLKNPGRVIVFDIAIQRKSRASLSISYNINQEEPSLIFVALVQPHVNTVVKSGENSGRNLEHVNVVRQLTTHELLISNSITGIEIPADLQSETLKAIVFVQSKKDNRITAVASIDIPAEQH